MEQEHFISGFCRTTDSSRTVTVETEDGRLLDVDCCYESCIHAASCVIAEKIRKLTKSE